MFKADLLTFWFSLFGLFLVEVPKGQAFTLEVLWATEVLVWEGSSFFPSRCALFFSSLEPRGLLVTSGVGSAGAEFVGGSTISGPQLLWICLDTF